MSRKRENLEDPVGLLRDFAREPYYEQLEREHGAPLTPEDIGVSRNLSRVTAQILATLKPREEKILRQRFLGQGMTLEEVAKDYEVTRERIREIQNKALRKMRHPSRSQRLKTFLTTDEKRRDLNKRIEDRASEPIAQHKEPTMSMTIDEALDIVKRNADEGDKSIQQLEAHLGEARRMAGPAIDRQIALAKESIAAARTVIAWVEEKRLGQ